MRGKCSWPVPTKRRGSVIGDCQLIANFANDNDSAKRVIGPHEKNNWGVAKINCLPTIEANGLLKYVRFMLRYTADSSNEIL